MAVDPKTFETTVVNYSPEGLEPPAGFGASVIDLGFNSAKLANYHVNDRTSFRVISQEDAKVKLGEELDETGFLAEAPVERTLRVLKLFREVIDLESPRYVLPVATSAVREAANREEFLDLAKTVAGFDFRILSEEEEALLSYFGAVASLRIPSGVFFDLGGGTLAMVSSAGYKVRKVLSLPLGARRLTFRFANKNGLFQKKGYEKLKDRIFDLLPSRRELRLERGAKLVGVGGTIRAMARFHQTESGYALEKVHNYRMSYEDVNWCANRFLKMNKRDRSSMRAIGPSRSETMAAGACVVRSLMKKLGFSELVCSAHGLREGTLSLFLHDKRWFKSKILEPVTIERQLSSAGRMWVSNWDRYLSEMFSAKLISSQEYSLLSQARQLTKNTLRTADLRTFFLQLVSVDSPLSHRDQLVLAISIVASTSIGYSRLLYEEFSPPLKRKDRKAVRRLSSAFELLELLDRMSANLKISLTRRGMKLDIAPSGTISEELIARAVGKVRDDFEVALSYTVAKRERSSPLEMLR